MHVYEIEYKCQINIHETLVTGRPKWEFGLNHNIISFMYFSSLFIKKNSFIETWNEKKSGSIVIQVGWTELVLLFYIKRIRIKEKIKINYKWNVKKKREPTVKCESSPNGLDRIHNQN